MQHKIIANIYIVKARGSGVICDDDCKEIDWMNLGIITTVMVIGCCRYSSDLVWKRLEITFNLQF